MAEPGDGSDEMWGQQTDGGQTQEQSRQETADQSMAQNRESERSAMQTIYDGLRDAKNTVSTAAGIEVKEDKDTAEQLADSEEAKRSIQNEINGEFAELTADAQLNKRELEKEAVAKDDRLQEVDKQEEALSNYENSLEGGEVDGEFRFGVHESLVNTNFLADDVVSMRNVEDNAYTHGDHEGSSLPFIEKADQLDSDARGWAERFSGDFQSALNSLGTFVDAFNLDERKEAYESTVEVYNKTDEFEDRIEEIAEEAGTELEEVNGEIGNDYEGELDEDGLEIIREAQEVVGGQLNEVDDPVGEVDFNPAEREKAEESVRQLRARSLDATALHKQRLDEARWKIGEVQGEINGLRDEADQYKEEVEDLTQIDGVDEGFSSLFEEMGEDTIMDVASRDDYSSNAAFQEYNRQNDGEAIPDEDEIRDAAFEALNEIAADMDYLDLVPTETVRETGDDYSDDDQRRRMHEAVYDSAESIVHVMDELEKKIPDLDQYDMEWEGEEETLEEERREVYDKLDIAHPSSPREALEEPDEYEE